MTKVIEKIMPTVVEVISEQHKDPMKKGFEMRKKGKRQENKNNHFSSGSGFVISADGYVITNAHVVSNIFDGGIIHITFENGERYEVDLVNYDEDSDIALLKIKENQIQFPFVVWGSTPEVGEKTIAIGSPLNLAFSATFGNVSALDRFVPNAPAFVLFIQTDAAVNPGNSGGPLFNENGEVIGINSVIMTSGPDKGSIGLGFAIDGIYAQKIITRLKTGEKIVRPFVGITYRPVKKEDTKHYKVGIGAYIEGIILKSPADNILEVGDIILEIGGEEIKYKMLATEISTKKPYTNIIFTVIRNDKKILLIVKLGKIGHDFKGRKN
jgi:serine protease Do